TGEHQIYTVRPDGTDLKGPLTTAGINLYPTWNKAADRIIFRSSRDTDVEGQSELYIMGPNGENQVRLTKTTPPVAHNNPRISPDGSRILFGSSPDLVTGLSQDLFTIGLNGQDLRRITDYPGIETYPSWSAVEP
ncbi:MAG TPA: hypothetical protein VND68_10035, partial [Chloroflexia bacterium]|nr:hypothetical protein [Chloroflexia bacterium]